MVALRARAKTEVVIFWGFRVLLWGALVIAAFLQIFADVTGLWAFGCDSIVCDDHTFSNMVMAQVTFTVGAAVVAWLLDRLLARGIRRRAVAKNRQAS